MRSSRSYDQSFRRLNQTLPHTLIKGEDIFAVITRLEQYLGARIDALDQECYLGGRHNDCAVGNEIGESHKSE